ncbi:XRE family transcriptional regulator [Catenulispora pinisilvae]|uniref:XRE family transcriptional regulator n=1 Tax=Catenulispora pinisilvae TaxID=2705253 RepID=UPI00189208E4|nr:XRE family transcriptional regulator [Catenulispora pinisilvae]
MAATKRRDFLTLAGLGLLDASPRMLGQPDVATMRSRFDRLRDLDNYLGGADTFRLYGTELAHTERLLNEGRYSAATRIALTELAAEQAQQAGWAAFDAGHPAPALQLFEYSRRAADDAGSSDLVANSFVHIAYASDADEATRAADAARHALPVDAAPTTLALVATRRAWSYAVAGDAQGAERALDEAWTSLESSSATDAPHWSSWVDSKEIEIMTGRVWAVLHVPDKAVPALEIALANYPDQWARDKALYSTWLADAYIDAGAIDQAASVLNHAITLADPVASVRPANRIKEVVRRLTGYDLPAVASLTERAAKINPPLVALL